MASDEELERRNATATAEWDSLSRSFHQDVEGGCRWIEQNIDLPVAGQAISLLFLYEQSDKVVELANKWLEIYIEHPESPSVVGRLLEFRPTDALLGAAKRFIDEAFTPSCNFDRKLRISTVISAIASNFADGALAQSVAQYLENDYRNAIWEHVFPICTYDKPNPFAENLTARWIMLNCESDFRFLPMTPIASLTRSSEVVQACFHWMQRGGKNNEDLSFLLTDVLNEAERCPEIVQDLGAFTRSWLLENPDHDESGRVYGALINASDSKADFEDSLSWYKNHKANQTSSSLISALLEYEHRNGSSPSPYVIAEAKNMLKQDRDFPVLARALLRFCPDDEVIKYLKSQYREHGLDWIGVILLRYANEKDTVSMVLEREQYWSLDKNAPGILHALLFAAPENKKIRELSSNWIQKNSEHRLVSVVQNAMNGKFDW